MVRFNVPLILVGILSAAILVQTFTADADHQKTRDSYYAQGLADGKAQEKQRTAKAPAEIQSMADGFCSGTMLLSWFDPSMGITQADIDEYAARDHNCEGARFLGVVVSKADPVSDYIFEINTVESSAWWVFSIVNGKIVSLQ